MTIFYCLSRRGGKLYDGRYIVTPDSMGVLPSKGFSIQCISLQLLVDETSEKISNYPFSKVYLGNVLARASAILSVQDGLGCNRQTYFSGLP